ncbi:hypothetical protein [Baaleninema simplex]|uniref:hypothetical protein n=1 Tax=Baaleninema simplex TaxID=2862350 RepID=UPI00034C97B7|nr:hypothetical protein [Baaleninema simplex]
MVRLPWRRPPQPDPDPSESPSGLGTFGGVFTPSILTILGVIMYLRFGWVVANVGWGGSLAIVTLSTAITFLTGLSISAIATDRVVRVGGAYYMISRSLGIETGGAVGIPLYFAQALSVALYTLGFAESLINTFPVLSNVQTVVALITTIAVAALAIQSANLAIRAQYFIMAAIVLSLLSFAFGHPVAESDIGVWNVSGRVGEPFWAVFAVFFPAVTGIMSGVNMSGDLRDPSKSIPIGTLSAIGVGYLIYMILPVFLSTRADFTALTENPLVMRDIALWGDAILLGVWGATLSSALGSILGAPRVLQALARDGVLPRSLRWLGQGHGPDDEPRLGTFVTLGVAVAAVCVGDLNLIAPVLTMFFLSTYMVLNVSAAIEGFLQSPSFRPTFRVHWFLSLIGALGCLSVMVLINAAAAVVAAILVAGIYIWLERRELQSAWGDVRRGLWIELARLAILNLGDTPDTKNWRPNILVLSGAPMRRWPLIELAAAFTHNRGLITVASILPSGSRDLAQQASLESKIREYVEKRGVQALVRIVTAPDPFVGAERLIEAYGLGPLVPNTVLLGDSEQEALRQDYCKSIATLHRSRRSVVIFRENPELGFRNRRRIDVWWGGLQSNGGLMLLLAYLLRTSDRWRGATIYLKLVVPNETAAQAARANLDNLAQQLRIGAVSQVLVSDGRPFPEILRESSRAADLVCLGMATPRDGEDFSEYYGRLQAMASDLPTTLFVLAASDFAFEEVLQGKD